MSTMKGKIERSKLIQLIHIAKAQLGLTDTDYRAVLESASRKSSCSDMTLSELDGTLKAMKKLGFRVKKMETKKIELGCVSEEQMDYIKGMWELVAREKTDSALYKFITRITGADHPRFMSAKGATDVITALRKMMIASGYNPDRKENVNVK
ncbi:MAG: regulatory protein GemA [Bacteroides sp.]|nr:regulatory protein GemA [Prevotella sp.]MCM1407066.1 regulatory protein GemA [Treponema brennaborense]MCM1470218.1 regulatory protein GemA [Bacteroides sp.]